ncbi:MAG TPA: hypothetical protein VLL72_08040 [Kiloniellales bacterium]|nr:hypothetical protein [Kiloniellales bacterium]
MPILERDPWRMQYFEDVDCPDDVRIPTDDGDCYELFPQYRWLYNKLMICDSQGLPNGPHGLDPKSFPVFSKPIYNMRGMGAGTRIFRSMKEYRLHQRPGHLWMPLLEGEHVSTDCAVVRGEARWWRHSIGHSIGQGMFDYWQVLAEDRPQVEATCGAWLRQNLSGYSGIVNFETIGATIIEAHLRFSDQWPDLYGAGWLEALVRLYRDGTWDYADSERRDGFSVVLFGAHGIQYRHPDPDLVREIRALPEVTSVQITFHEDRPPQTHSMPPGGFRLAIVNGWDLEVGRKARERLALAFWSTQQVVARRTRKGRAAE